MTADDADDIRAEAKTAAAVALPIDDACRWPYDSEEGRYFKAEFIMHKAALLALGMHDKPLTPN